MKTSNKILLGLLIVVFTLPFLLASSLKSKIEKGEYTVEKNENETNGGSMHSGSFTAYKVVKVVAPRPELLTCHLKLSDKMDYRYYNGDSKDSIMVFTSNDTLYIKYTIAKVTGEKNESREYNSFMINVNLPAFNNLVVDGAVVGIDSLPASSDNISVTLKNRGVIKDASKNREEESAKVSPAADVKNDKVSKSLKAQASIDSDKRKRVAAKNIHAEILDLDIRDLLIFGFLYRI